MLRVVPSGGTGDDGGAGGCCCLIWYIRGMADFASHEYHKMTLEMQNVIEGVFRGERLAKYPVQFSLLRDVPYSHKDLEDYASRDIYVRLIWRNPLGGEAERSVQLPSPMAGAYISRGNPPAEGWWGRDGEGFRLHAGALQYLVDVLEGEAGEFLEDAESRGII